jgi:hypothetical protein
MSPIASSLPKVGLAPAAELPRGHRFTLPPFAGNPNGVVVYPPYLMDQYCECCCVSGGTNACEDAL